MVLHPELVAFQGRLEEIGEVAALHSDHLCVRLPLLCAVRVRYDGSRLRCEPRFGATSRTAATAMSFAAAAAAVGGLLLADVAMPALITGGLLVVLATAYNVMRYVISEAAVTRVSLLWGTRLTIAASAAVDRTHGQTRPLAPGDAPSALAAQTPPLSDRVRAIPREQ